MTTSNSPLGTLSAAQTLHRCPTCSCSNTLEDKLTHEARTRISYYQAKGLKNLAMVDTGMFIVEDEHGGLMTCQGDLSFMMPSAPVLDRLTAPQLNADIRDAYWQYQSAIWDLNASDCDPLCVNGRQVVIFPIYVDRRRFTVTVSNAVQTEKVAA